MISRITQVVYESMTDSAVQAGLRSSNKRKDCLNLSVDKLISWINAVAKVSVSASIERCDAGDRELLCQETLIEEFDPGSA